METTTPLSRTLGEATWITGSGRALNAHVHRPDDGFSLGTVVLAPSIAREQVVSYRTLRVLAIMLAEQGYTAVRFAYSGTGESEDQPAETPGGGPSWIVEHWTEDLSAVFDFARRIGGHQTVHGIGLRLGAAMLMEAEPQGLGTRLLWEPVGGRMFIRQHATLRRMGLPEGPEPLPGMFELGGYTLSVEQAAAVEQLADPAKCGDQLPDGAVLVKEDDTKVARKIYATVSLWATTPPESLQKLISRLPRLEPVALPDWEPATTATISVPGFRVPVIEEHVKIGSKEIPAVYTSPVGEIRGPAAQFAAASAEGKDGATALWVAAARRLAAQGIPAIRFERPGCGDLGRREDMIDPNPYTSEVVSASVDTAWWLMERTGRPATGIGLCAGAWLMATTSDRAPLDRVLMINNVAWRQQLSFYDGVYANMSPTKGVDALRNMESVVSQPGLKTRVKELLRSDGPYAVWLALGMAGKVNAPEVMMEIGSRSNELLLVFGAEDRKMFEQEKGTEGLRRLRRAGRSIEVRNDIELDHALLAEQSRRNAIAIVEDTMLHRVTPSDLAGSAAHVAEAPRQTVPGERRATHGARQQSVTDSV